MADAAAVRRGRQLGFSVRIGLSGFRMRKAGVAAFEHRRRLAAWVAREIMPHEPGVRAWLQARRVAPDEVEEIAQDAYCALASLDAFDHIQCPRAYYFSLCRNLLIRRLKRRRIVSFEAIAEIDAFRDDAPSPEDVASGRSELARVTAFIAGLPERCRAVVQLRKIEGWSQKRIAAHLGMSEKAVEKQVWLGVRAIRAAWSTADTDGGRGAARVLARDERR